MEGSTFTIRPAIESDIREVIRLVRRSWLVAWAPEIPFYAVQAFAAHDPVPAVVRTRWPMMWVGILDGRLVARIDVEEDRLENIDIDPTVWRRGFGKRMLAHSESLIAAGYKTARLDVRAFNNRAINFYQQHGWSEARRYPGTECGAPVETVEMRKPL